MAVLEAEVKADPTSHAWELYYQIRSRIETPENIGKLILFDLDSGDYEIANDELGFDAANTLRARQPEAKVFCLRIGYEAVSSFDGGVERLPQ